MAIFKAGEKISKIFKNGQEISTIYKDGQLIYRNALPIYGIRRNIANSATTWERIEASKGKTAEAYLPTNTSPVNDFDKIYPWSAIITCNVDAAKNEITAVLGDDNFAWDGTNGEVMTYIPEFWIKREQVAESDGTYEYIRISGTEQDGYVHIEPFMVGRYTASGTANDLHSKSNIQPYVNVTFSNYKTYVKAKGENWCFVDWRWFVLQELYLIEYADYKIQDKIGEGITDRSGASSTISSGGCDSLEMKSGSAVNDGKHSVIYRGIEDIFGHIYQMLDGINANNYKIYICYNPNKYELNTYTGEYKELSYAIPNHQTDGTYIAQYGYDENNQLIKIPIKVKNEKTEPYLGYMVSKSTAVIPWMGGYTVGKELSTLWSYNIAQLPTDKGSFAGVRLLLHDLKITEISVETANKTKTGETIATITHNGIGPFTYEITNKSDNFDEYIELQDNKLILKKDIPEEVLTFSADINVKNRTGSMSYSYSQIINGSEVSLYDTILNSNQIIEEKPNFGVVETSDQTGKIYKDIDDFGDVYYFRGKVDNNWVKFGTNSTGQPMFWRIIRTNGDKTVRLIYSGAGTPAKTGAGTIAVSSQTFNLNGDNNQYVGYEWNTTRVHAYGAGATKSNALNQLNTWFENNLLNDWNDGNGLIDKNAGFCNDRSRSTNSSAEWSETMPESGEAGRISTYYGAFLRIYNGSKEPTLKFSTISSRTADSFTYKKASTGTKSLIYPVGLITIDEVVYAGGYPGYPNNQYYLYNATNYWTMSPYRYFTKSGSLNTNMFYVMSNGNNSNDRVIEEYDLRPVINIVNTAIVTAGNGTIDEPYEISNGGGSTPDTPDLKIVTFAEGTDDEIKAMLDAHYNGDINIADYWKVGDTRLVHIDALEATENNSCAHVAQDMTMVIMDFNHDDLVEPINGAEKAAVTVGFREVMGNNGSSENEYYWGSRYTATKDSDNYSANPLRTWLNGDLLNALPATFSSMIKEVNKGNLKQHQRSTPPGLGDMEENIITQDKMWLLSYPEIFGNERNEAYLNNAPETGLDPDDMLERLEGKQYEYMKTSTNRVKWANNNGETGPTYNKVYCWLRSPSWHNADGVGYGWCCLDNGEIVYRYGTVSSGLAPGFCL